MLDLFARRYDAKLYNCGHFVIDFLNEIGSDNLLDVKDVTSLKNLRKISLPVSPCVVMMRSAHRDLHCGVFYLNKVIHLIESGVRADQLSDLTEFKIDFYQCPQ